MRLPEKPPKIEDSIKLISDLAKDSANTLDKFKPYVDIINGEYLHWDELRIDNRFGSIDRLPLWSFAKLLRTFNTRSIKLNGYVLNYVQTAHIEKMLHNLDMCVGGKIDLDAQIPNSELQKKYLINSLMEEAIASSQLEGAATTRVVAKRMLREKRKPLNVSEQMILNNYVTMMYIKEHTEQNQKLTLGLIKEIHKKITNSTLDDESYEGSFRADNEVKIFSRDEGQLIYEPPDYQEITKLLEQLCIFVNTEAEMYYLHPFVKAIIIHYMIGRIHPFNDGNGRTARALFYWFLISQNYKYLEYIAISTAIKNAHAQYSRAYLYSETDNDDITYFIKFNLLKIDIAVTAFEKYIVRTKDENKKIFETIRQNPKLNFRQADVLIDVSKNERPMTFSEMQERYHITYQTARADLLDLTKQGYLKMFKKGKKFVFFVDKEKCMSTNGIDTPK